MALTEEEREYIKNLNSVNNGSVSRTCSDFQEKYGYSVSRSTVLRIWKENGLPTEKRGGQRRGLSQEEFNRLFLKHNGDFGKMAEESGYAEESLRRRYNRVNPNRPKRYSLSDDEFMKLVVYFNLDFEKIAKVTGFKASSLRSRFRYGIPRRIKGKYLDNLEGIKKKLNSSLKGSGNNLEETLMAINQINIDEVVR